MFQKITRVFAVICICAFCMGANNSCDGQQQPQQSTSGATQTHLESKIPKNSRGLTTEQQNINDRIKITTDPTKVLWIHLIALDGNIIRRMPVRCKTTSSGKRLEPTRAHSGAQYGYSLPSATGSYHTDELIQPDGTYGESDHYIYWFDPMSRYHQWGTAGGLGYLLTDYPIDLENPIDKITGLYRVQKEALEWQKSQEEQLKRAESKNFKEEVKRQEAEIPKKENSPSSTPPIRPAPKVKP